jgi:hypothetical protein
MATSWMEKAHREEQLLNYIEECYPKILQEVKESTGSTDGWFLAATTLRLVDLEKDIQAFKLRRKIERLTSHRAFCLGIIVALVLFIGRILWL